MPFDNIKFSIYTFTYFFFFFPANIKCPACDMGNDWKRCYLGHFFSNLRRLCFVDFDVSQLMKIIYTTLATKFYKALPFNLPHHASAVSIHGFKCFLGYYSLFEHDTKIFMLIYVCLKKRRCNFFLGANLFLYFLSSSCKNDFFTIRLYFYFRRKITPRESQGGFLFKSKPNSQEVFTLSLKKNWKNLMWRISDISCNIPIIAIYIPIIAMTRSDVVPNTAPAAAYSLQAK